jgi:hypothetical protein
MRGFLFICFVMVSCGGLLEGKYLYSFMFIFIVGSDKMSEMRVVGTVSSEDEHRELRFIAEVFILGERVRSLARQYSKR